MIVMSNDTLLILLAKSVRGSRDAIRRRVFTLGVDSKATATIIKQNKNKNNYKQIKFRRTNRSTTFTANSSSSTIGTTMNVTITSKFAAATAVTTMTAVAANRTTLRSYEEEDCN